MKTPLRFALALSLAVNAALVVALLLHGTDTPSASAVAVNSAPPTPVKPPSIDSHVWSDLKTEDLPALVARLRASGFPPEVVRAIVRAQIDESFAARRKALTANESAPFWKGQMVDLKRMAALRQLDREQTKQLRALLGADAEDPSTQNVALQSRSLDFLPADKADAVRQVLRDYLEKRMDMYFAGISLSTDRARYDAIEKEQHAALASLLTPAELLNYDMRNSNTANNLRSELSAFDATEAEYRAIYQLRAQFDERWGLYAPMGQSPAERQQRAEAQKALNDQIKATLGPERSAEYERATDFNYRQTSQLVARLEMPPETTNQLWTVQKEFQKRGSDLYRSATSAEDRAAVTHKLTALRDEAVARVTPILGSASRVDAYKQYGGSWLDRMVPQQQPTKRP